MAFDCTEPFVLSATTRLAAVTLIGGSSLEQFTAPPVRTHGQSVRIEVGVGLADIDVVAIVGLSFGADTKSQTGWTAPRSIRISVEGDSAGEETVVGEVMQQP